MMKKIDKNVMTILEHLKKDDHNLGQGEIANFRNIVEKCIDDDIDKGTYSDEESSEEEDSSCDGFIVEG